MTPHSVTAMLSSQGVKPSDTTGPHSVQSVLRCPLYLCDCRMCLHWHAHAVGCEHLFGATPLIAIVLEVSFAACFTLPSGGAVL